MSRQFPMEPYKIKMTEPIKMTSREERNGLIVDAGYNIFKLRSRDVMVDLLTDSGTGSMSQSQWGALIQGDESYAGSESFYRFEKAVQDVTGYKYVIPTHQGRGAEALFFYVMDLPDKIIPNNTHFDTTRANISVLGGEPVDLPCKETKDLHSDYPFKGNIDLERLESLLKTSVSKIPCILMTITNNAVGGQPVSISNLKGAASLAKKYGVPLYLDACRFSENIFLARERDPDLKGLTMLQIAREYFSQADGCLFSAKKDAMANIGGFFATNNAVLAEKMRERMVVTEGFPTYGGLAGRDLDAIAVGIREGIEEDYLAYRTGMVAWLAERLLEEGVPVVTPPGGHAVFVDAKSFLPHIPKEEFPAQALVCALYLEGGIRAVEIGTFMFGEAAQHELVRLAIPHRLYTQGHFEHVIATFKKIKNDVGNIYGYKIKHAPKYLRHFTSVLEPANNSCCNITSLPASVLKQEVLEFAACSSNSNRK